MRECVCVCAYVRVCACVPFFDSLLLTCHVRNSNSVVVTLIRTASSHHVRIANRLHFVAPVSVSEIVEFHKQIVQHGHHLGRDREREGGEGEREKESVKGCMVQLECPHLVAAVLVCLIIDSGSVLILFGGVTCMHTRTHTRTRTHAHTRTHTHTHHTSMLGTDDEILVNPTMSL